MRVYVAGPYSDNNVIDILNHMRNGMRVAARILLAGHEPFCPWLDYHFSLMLRDNETLTVDDYYRYSLSWLEVSDAIVVIDGWQKSRGTLTEIKRAKELGIPIYYGLDAFFAAMKVKNYIHYEIEPDSHQTNNEKLDDRLI